MTNKQYGEYTEKRSEKSPVLSNCVKAFLVGGTICTIGELFSELFSYLGADKDTSLLMASIMLIFTSGLLTGIGVFDKIAKFGGGGALVPITGFANSVVSPAIEAKSEGYVTGVASKIFTIAGPVIVYGVFSSVIYGIIYFLCTM
ncbi:MAG: stage V sporulation protein AC [Ruminococcaceae bacterium]|nr:stage V sporulation protein AC [Oscillospiraceae bacterium]